jgi:hypothetical protein
MPISRVLLSIAFHGGKQNINFRLNPESNAENCPKSKVHDQWVDESQ